MKKRLQDKTGVTLDAHVTMEPVLKPFVIQPFVNTIQLRKMGRLAEAEKMYIQELQEKEELYGQDDVALIPTLEHLASLYP